MTVMVFFGLTVNGCGVTRIPAATLTIGPEVATGKNY